MRRIIGFALMMLLIILSSPLPGSAQERDRFPQDLPDPAVEQAALEFIEMYHPSHLDDFRRMKGTQPEAYRKEIATIFHRIEQLRNLQEEHPQRYDIEIQHMILEEQISVLARSFLPTKDEIERHNIRRELESRVSEQFDLREKMKEFEVQFLEAELQELREKLRHRQENKSEIVQLRVKQLLNNGAGLGWE